MTTHHQPPTPFAPLISSPLAATFPPLPSLNHHPHLSSSPSPSDSHTFPTFSSLASNPSSDIDADGDEAMGGLEPSSSSSVGGDDMDQEQQGEAEEDEGEDTGRRMFSGTGSSSPAGQCWLPGLFTNNATSGSAGGSGRGYAALQRRRQVSYKRPNPQQRRATPTPSHPLSSSPTPPSRAYRSSTPSNPTPSELRNRAADHLRLARRAKVVGRTRGELEMFWGGEGEWGEEEERVWAAVGRREERRERLRWAVGASSEGGVIPEEDEEEAEVEPPLDVLAEEDPSLLYEAYHSTSTPNPIIAALTTASPPAPCPACTKIGGLAVREGAVGCLGCGWSVGKEEVEAAGGRWVLHSEGEDHKPLVTWNQFVGTMVLCSACDEEIAL